MRLTWLVLTMYCSVRLLFAQPQAPIEWGEERWAYLAGWPGLPQITTWRVIPMGDTLLFTALNVGSPVSDTILVCSSFDNGQTFTPWHPITQGNEFVSAQFAGSAGRYYAFFSQGAVPPEAIWLRTSDDGGLSWGAPQQYRTDAYAMCGLACGNEVLAKYIGSWNDNNWRTCVIRSSDGGQSWSPPMVIDTADFYIAYFDQSIAFTAQDRLIIEEPAPHRFDPRVYVAQGDSTGQNWTTFQVLPCDYGHPWAAQRANIAGDTSSEAAGVLSVFAEDLSSPLTPFFFHREDIEGGWDSCVQIGPRWAIPPFGSTLIPANMCDGRLWLVGWEHMSGTGWNYLGTRFSANHGKNWYALQMAADSLVGLLTASVQFRENQIDLYWVQGCNATLPWDYRMVRGTITPDTTRPELAPGTALPDTVRVGQQLQFSATVTDNDTLSEVRLAIVTLSADTLRFGMLRGADHVYQFTWMIPDSGYYDYWFEAEDFWENIATLPDTGTFHFVTEGWSASADFILHPSSFILSVFPNPCNMWPTIQLSPDWLVQGPAEVVVYNALGQEVIRQTATSTLVAVSPEIPAASGTYLLQVSNRTHSALQKFVVLK